MPEEYRPHPLVVDAARGLKVKAPKPKQKRGQPPQVLTKEEEDAAVVKAFDDLRDRAELVLYAGFSGSQFERPDESKWEMLYVDSRLQSWLLIEQEDIVVRDKRDDDSAPKGVRDFLWVKAGARIVRGHGPRSNDGRFLVGDFTRAGDFAASAKGGTFSASTGLLCEATTPGCCQNIRRTP